jgi:predicted membrane chloride channel (bestrophin family)
MRSRFRTRWAVAAFIVIGVAVALLLVIRTVTADDVVEEDGTTPAFRTA